MPTDIHLPKNPTDAELAAAFAEGVLRKEELEDGAYYLGLCRNASVARWNATTQEFSYVQTKFGNKFEETIKHTLDEKHYDAFLPLEKVEPEASQVVAGR